MLGFEKLRLIGAFRRGIRIHISVDLIEQRRRISVVKINQPLVLRVLRFLLARIFVHELPINLVRLRVFLSFIEHDTENIQRLDLVRVRPQFGTESFFGCG